MEARSEHEAIGRHPPGLEHARVITAIGLMSGTSVDGVDACLVRMTFGKQRFQHEILGTHSREVPETLRARLLRCMAEQTIHLEEWCALNIAVGELFAETAMELMLSHSIEPERVDCIGSHGQTLYHWPPERDASGRVVRLGGTLQIGEPSIIAERTGVRTIADFRPRDMAAGGEGAPLVCFADHLLFQDERMGRCIQNIGGIANVTVLPSRTAQAREALPIIAFDTGPGNMLMDAAMARFFGEHYDANGETAARGKIHPALLTELLAHPYLSVSPPKTTGREAFGMPYLEEMRQRYPDIPGETWLATLNAFTAQTIVNAYERFIFPRYEVVEMVVGGGGTHNATLLETIRAEFRAKGRAIALKTHADFGIPNQYKEALAFAILAGAAMTGIPNNIPDCTGAVHPVIMGKLVR